MYFIEKIIGVALIFWALFFSYRFLTRPFKKNCKDLCGGCAYTKKCPNKFNPD